MSFHAPEDPPSGMKTIVDHIYDSINRIEQARSASESRPAPRQARQSSSGGGGGGGVDSPDTPIQTIEIDASGGNVTELLPAAPPSGAAVVALRTDTSGNTGTLQVNDTSTETIQWPGRGSATSYDLHPYQLLLLVFDSGNWVVENPPVYEVESFVPGPQPADSIVWRHKAVHEVQTLVLHVDAETAPSSQHDLIVDLLQDDTPSRTVTTQATLSIASGVEDAEKTLDVTIPVGYVLRIKTDTSGGNHSSDMEDVSFNMDLIRA